MGNKLDQLFREGLDSYELQPTPKAWSEVHSHVSGGKKSFKTIAFSMAAAVMLLIIAGGVLMNISENSKTPLLSDINYPQPEVGDTWQFAGADYEELMVSAPVQSSTNQKDQSSQKLASRSEKAIQEDSGQNKVFEPLQVSTLKKSLIAIDLKDEEHALIGVEPGSKADEPFIKITYIAGSGEKERQGKLDKVISMAREVSPMELLSDIRSTKDNLFRKIN